MSDTMLHAVLLMPPDLWSDDPVDVAQRHGRYVEASRRIEADADTIARLRKIEAAAKNLVAQKGRHHTEQAYQRLAALVTFNG